MTTAEASLPVLEVERVSKYLTRDLRRGLRYAAADIRRDLIPRRGGSSEPPLRPGEVAVVDDLSLELRRGQSLALIGTNGAGKSTLLKLIYGLLKPNRGRIVARGRVGALIELGTGFDPVLTGRENITINGALIGLHPARLRTAVDEIVDFAELRDAIDAPVRTYSSGMVARLAFAVAALLEPDVLLVDEVLAVGDLEFQRRCVDHMRGFLARGGALILVSHNTPQILATCQRGLLLRGGRCAFIGTATEALSRYFELSFASPRLTSRTTGRDPANVGAVVVDEVQVKSPAGGALVTGEPAEVLVTYRAAAAVEVLWGFSVLTGDLWTQVTGAYNVRPLRLSAGVGTLRCTIPRMPLLTGRYGLTAAIVDPDNLHSLARFGHDEPPMSFSVVAPATLLHNGLVAGRYLTTVDVDWD